MLAEWEECGRGGWHGPCCLSLETGWLLSGSLTAEELGFRPLASALVVPFLLAAGSPDSGPTSSLLCPRTQPPPPPSGLSCPTSPQWHLPQNSFHVRARERKRLDPPRGGGGGGAVSKLSSDPCPDRGRYKSPSGPGGLRPQLSRPGHSVSRTCSFCLQTTPWGSATRSGRPCCTSGGRWRLTSRAMGKRSSSGKQKRFHCPVTCLPKTEGV